ncbi:hypothetical protein ABID22_001701 [Pontibacter aydingkolensis]|uniref:TolC family protein n=1 Tax=Pontibacter aydingkolensis TaxID=1911536 RepID=A0ABS7CU35_9BACT|nr:hypothetical protein [Pontibacter aydingkolensis]MBW7467366.1 hypothetical protein [Pontibacter aydingkolensis]
MKRILLLTFAATICTFATAQRLKLTDDALDKHVLEVNINGQAMAALELQAELNLTQEQYKLAMQLNQKRYEQIAEAEEVYQADNILRSKAIYSINLEADKSIGAILDPKQLRAFLELEGQRQLRLVSDNADE